MTKRINIPVNMKGVDACVGREATCVEAEKTAP
jgi:hypothetical protein